MISIKQGDALNLSFIADESIDLVVTSPPYFAVRVYKDGGKVLDVIGNEPTPAEYVAALSKWMAEMWRVLKPEGNVFVVLGDKMAGSGGHNNSAIGADKARGPGRYNQASNGVRKKSLMGLPWRFAIACIDAGWILRAEIVWAKPNGMPESVTDRVRRSHETIFHFTKSEKHYAAIDRLRVPHKPQSLQRVAEGYKEGAFKERQQGSPIDVRDSIEDEGEFLHPLGTAPSSVWTISTSGLTIPKETIEKLGADKHYAAFPPEIPRRAITGWAPEGGKVLDPFGGAGTTALVSKVLGRDCISTDISNGYTRVSLWRVHASDHAPKLTAKWKREGLLT